MMCVARRVPSENMANFAAQFTTKLDTNGLILSLDTSGITYGACPGLGRVNYYFFSTLMCMFSKFFMEWRKFRTLRKRRAF
jgi:hypothetical protein